MTERAAEPISAAGPAADEHAAGEESRRPGDTVAAPPASGAAPTPAGTGRRKRGLKSVRDMVISLVVIAVPIAFIVVIYPHHNANPVHVVSYAEDLPQVASVAPFPVRAPEGLSPMWRATSDTYAAPAANDTTWHIGFVTPLGKYAALEQTTGSARPLLDADASGVSADGSVTIDGSVWTSYAGNGHEALVRALGPHDTLVLAGSAGQPELRELAAALRTVKGPAGAPAAS